MTDAGFDALNPMEVGAGCDVVAFAETYGDKLAFAGGVNGLLMLELEWLSGMCNNRQRHSGD